MNMAGLWNLPVIYILENNQFGMGTSNKRHAHNSEFYSRYDSIPGLRCDGMDVYSVREAMALAKRHCTSGKGPILLELDTYRYHGHSMSDPGISYRSRDDIANVRAKRDPIERVRKILVETGIASEAELKEIEKAIKIEVEEAKVFAETSPLPDIGELYTEVETPNPPYIRGIESEPAGFGTRPY
jgi:pyruvate dehydrogenase E1 component alpha subunit